jgi:hypothetical protein
VFVAIKQNLRLCLICERVFTRQGAAEHPHISNPTASAQIATTESRLTNSWRETCTSNAMCFHLH